MPTAVEIAGLVVRLEDDSSRRMALDTGYAFFRAALEDAIVRPEEINSFAQAVGEAVEIHEYIGYRLEAGGAHIPTGPWTDYVLQSRSGYYSKLPGQQAAALYVKRLQGLAPTVPLDAGDRQPGASTEFLIDYVFSLPDPLSFPSIDAGANDDDLRILRRYVHQVRTLEKSSALNEPNAGYSMQTRQTETTLEARLPAEDALAGLATLFRHVYAPDESASFNRAMSVLQKALRESNARDDELEMLAAYGRAAGRLRKEWLRAVALDQGVRQGQVPSVLGRLGVTPELSPEQILSLFFYGQYLHWGDRAEALERLSQDPVSSVVYRLAFLQAISALTVVYGMFADLVEAALGKRAA